MYILLFKNLIWSYWSEPFTAPKGNGRCDVRLGLYINFNQVVETG